MADFTIYPNPNTGALFVNGNVLPTEIRCYNALGQQFSVTTAAAGAGAVRVETSGLAPGIYVLGLRLPNG